MPSHVSPQKLQGTRRATSRRVPPPQLTDRDYAVLRDVARFGALTLAQLAHRHFGASSTCSSRLARLAHSGYLVRRRIWYRGPSIYAATSVGTRLANVGLPVARLVPETLAHHLGVADLATWLVDETPGAAWTTERELRRDAMRQARERGEGYAREGTPHIPDGLMAGPDGRVAVELELTTKQRTAYERIFRWYAGALDYDRVRWFVRSEPTRRRLAEFVRQHDLQDFMAVDPLPENVAVPSWL